MNALYCPNGFVHLFFQAYDLYFVFRRRAYNIYFAVEWGTAGQRTPASRSIHV